MNNRNKPTDDGLRQDRHPDHTGRNSGYEGGGRGGRGSRGGKGGARGDRHNRGLPKFVFSAPRLYATNTHYLVIT